jgi:hypothetical protein
MRSRSPNVTSTIRVTEDDCRNVSWRLVETTPHYRRYIGTGTHPASGVEITVQKTEYLAEDELLAVNAERRNDNDGRRWSEGTGSEKGGNVPMVHVASVPLNKFFAEIAPRLTEGDQDFSKWWLRQSRNLPFRTRNGNL